MAQPTWEQGSSTQLPESPVEGLVVESVDNTGKIYYEHGVHRVLALSQYNPNQYSLAGLIGYWQVSDRAMATLPDGKLEPGNWYKVALATKFKAPGPNTNAGSMYLDIQRVRLATDDEIPAQQPTQAANSQQTGSQSRPDRPVGDFSAGMAFNQACTLVAALITSHPQARDWLDYDYVIEEVLIMRERLYHEVLMWPIGAPNEEPGTEHPDGEPDTSQHTPVGAIPEEPEMPPVTVAEEPEPDDLF